MWIDLRLRILHFLKNNAKIIGIALCVWVVVFLVNRFLKNYEPEVELQTTYEPHTSVMDNDTVPTNVSNEVEEMLEEYMGYCNEADWASAYNMLSASCKEYAFNNSLEEYMQYEYTKMPTEKKYAIQDYSNEGDTYIYQIKYTDDLLATGLTNTTYSYTEEKIVFKKQSDGTLEMAVGNFLGYHDIKNIFENDYLKVDVKYVLQYYSLEEYMVKLTNRSDDTIVISDGQASSEVLLNLASGDTRTPVDGEDYIVLGPKESKTYNLKFQKFYDNDDDASSLSFGNIRVMETYSGTENVDEATIESEIQNAIAKFSVNVPIKYQD